MGEVNGSNYLQDNIQQMRTLLHSTSRYTNQVPEDRCSDSSRNKQDDISGWLCAQEMQPALETNHQRRRIIVLMKILAMFVVSKANSWRKS